MTTEMLIEGAGWLGVIFYISAYFLISIGKLKSNAPLFHGLNIMGATGLIIDSVYYHDVPNLVVNVAWFGIGSYAIVHSWLRRSNN